MRKKTRVKVVVLAKIEAIFWSLRGGDAFGLFGLRGKIEEPYMIW